MSDGRTTAGGPAGPATGAPAASERPVELWGGLECTVVRIGDTFRDQSRETGHRTRAGDLAAVAALGIKTVRYPVLWETVAPDDPDACDWSFHDERLAECRDLGLDPIAGLVHHGSGPRYTDLTDPLFPEKLAVHAGKVAERYPWLRRFTPVNEPLTTARFSGLYGHWYPHGRDERTFLTALVNQVRGVALAMKAIRAVIPDARLVQTEDLGKTFSTPELAHQAAYENERRWLGFDLLCGRVGRDHPFRPALLHAGLAEGLLEALEGEPCPPDIIGVNHYLTSERYLDHRVDLFPATPVGGNGRQRYVDVEAVRAPLPAEHRGPAARLREAWARYGLPLAVTEAHLGCTREEQLRWLARVWDAAVTVRAEGADIRAVTVWTLFGAVDWNSLLTRRDGHYEPGAFDIRGARPRRTALARAAASLASSGRIEHPALDGDGWWERPGRYFPALATPGEQARRPARPPRPLAIVGDGRLGRAVAEACDLRGLSFVLLGRAALDPADAGQVQSRLAALRPWAVVNCCGFPAAGNAEAEPDRCVRDNVVSARALAASAASVGAAYAVLSSDRVFDGAAGAVYREGDRTSPLCLFGRTKESSEMGVLTAHPSALVVRTGPLFGAGRPGLLADALARAADAAGVARWRDLVVTPTYIPDLVDTMLDLLIDQADGLWHLAHDGEIDAAELARRLVPEHAARLASLQARRALAGSQRRLSLASARAGLLPSLSQALDRHHRSGMLAAAE
ncbi:MAG: sugar nucleotide-binding protein [Alsobacter sp.]